MKKKAISLLIVLLLFACLLQAQVFAANWVSASNMNVAMNAYTWGTPTDGTPVTAYTYSGSTTQQWNSISFPGLNPPWYYLSSVANPSVVIAYVGSSAAVLKYKNGNVYQQAIKVIYEGMSGGYGMYGLANTHQLLALTCSNTANGAAITWQPSNGQTNQLWVARVW